MEVEVVGYEYRTRDDFLDDDNKKHVYKVVGCTKDEVGGCSTLISMVSLQKNLMKKNDDAERMPPRYYCAEYEAKVEVEADAETLRVLYQHDDRMLKIPVLFHREIDVYFPQKIDSMTVFYDLKQRTRLQVLPGKNLQQQSVHQVQNYRYDDEASLVE